MKRRNESVHSACDGIRCGTPVCSTSTSPRRKANSLSGKESAFDTTGPRERRPDSLKRRLLAAPTDNLHEPLKRSLSYGCSDKHKMHALAFGSRIPGGSKRDATRCDEHAGFTSDRLPTIPRLIKRGLCADLVAKVNQIWTLADDGWIYEGRPTNVETSEYHGYPVLKWESIARPVYKRYSDWAQAFGSNLDRIVAKRSRLGYRF